MTDEPLRIGVLGAARIAELSVVGPARATGHRLVAVAARDRDRAEAFAARHGVERVGLLRLARHRPGDRGRPQPVGQQSARAVDSGRRPASKRITEKPSASDAAEAAEVHEAVAKAGTVFIGGFHSCSTRSPGACTSCWTAGSWATSGTSRRRSPCPRHLTTTYGGNSHWPAAR